MLKHLTFTVALCAATVAQSDTVADDLGTLNPEELSLNGLLDRLSHDQAHPMEYALGYGAAKAGLHAEARRIFEGAAARLNSAQAMTWLAWMDDNGLAGPENPKAAAEWDRRAAALGSEVGMFNYGLDLLRGRGVAQDDAQGRQMIERAANLGDTSARHLIENQYDLDSVTPDADAWKYAPKLF
ncbi:Sel1 repeat protein [Puniceibacterium sp. IMCC21224]|nr:Sel1 repeat protein [Puniceibacterium sp. IMCC21224]